MIMKINNIDKEKLKYYLINMKKQEKVRKCIGNEMYKCLINIQKLK